MIVNISESIYLVFDPFNKIADFSINTRRISPRTAIPPANKTLQLIATDKRSSSIMLARILSLGHDMSVFILIFIRYYQRFISHHASQNMIVPFLYHLRKIPQLAQFQYSRDPHNPSLQLIILESPKIAVDHPSSLLLQGFPSRSPYNMYLVEHMLTVIELAEHNN